MSCYRSPLFLALVCVPAMVAGAATNYDHIPANIKTSSNPSTFQSQIDSVINAEVAKLRSDDPAAQKSGRGQLIYEIECHNGTTATTQYQAEYAQRITLALRPLADPKNRLRVRLNAAILAAEVAGVAHRSGGAAVFSGLASTFLQDKDAPVIIWGMKIAKYAVADAAVAGTNPTNLLKLVTQTVKAHGDSGVIVEEAYATLTLEPYRNRQDEGVSDQVARAAAFVVPDLLDIVRWRTEQYRGGNDVPASPLAEEKADLFLSIQAFRTISSNAAQLNQTLAALGDLTCATLHVISDGNTSPDVVEVARANGGALVVLGSDLKNAQLSEAGNSIKEISASTPSDQLRVRCNNLASAVKAMGVTIHTQFDAASSGSTGDAPVVDRNPAAPDANPVAGDGSK